MKKVSDNVSTQLIREYVPPSILTMANSSEKDLPIMVLEDVRVQEGLDPGKGLTSLKGKVLVKSANSVFKYKAMIPPAYIKNGTNIRLFSPIETVSHKKTYLIPTTHQESPKSFNDTCPAISYMSLH